MKFFGATKLTNCIISSNLSDAEKNIMINTELVRLIQTYTETFRREKSARNTVVSSTREFWDLRLKTKSWNFFEVR